MKEFKVLQLEIWAYSVEAKTKEEAELKCIDGDWIGGDLEEVKILYSEEVTDDTRS